MLYEGWIAKNRPICIDAVTGLVQGGFRSLGCTFNYENRVATAHNMVGSLDIPNG
jgi:hypothetical protein